ncbi:LOW QUALITY PROTEIN: Helitron helicase [Phytophthora megakarya]|uniref:Helitron helicase n=1 Tax=Phytophthora megakarya TaxID=4795 RepID=A0A225V0G5_9STRA|nr:LOW QUALITY PROTEIN: Helitron helicase [Phytophthora megakarya]
MAAAAVPDWSRFQFYELDQSLQQCLHFYINRCLRNYLDDSGTRDGVYNFRVQGTVCHRIGSLLTSSNRRNMFAQVYINDPDMAARVESRIGMTDGLDLRILETIDHVMVTHNEYARGFLNARDIMVQQAGDRYQEALVEYRRRVGAGESTENNPALRLDNFLPENISGFALHVTRHANPGTHNMPTASEVAAIVINQGAVLHRDILLKTRGGGFRRIFESSSSYLYFSRTVNEDGHTTFLPCE